MCSDTAIEVREISKRYEIYTDPKDRLKQYFLNRVRKLLRRPTKNYYSEFWALRNVDIRVKKGETIGIVGSNGSGKSTLLKMISGTLTPSTGALKTSGRIAALLELGSGFNPAYTGRENVYTYGALLGMSDKEIDEKFPAIQAFAEIGAFIDQPLKTYSSGMHVRLAFAVHTCIEPDILIIDEALAVGDAYFVHRCFDHLRQMKARGVTIIFVTHDTEIVKNLCDRAYWINQGTIKSEGHPDKVVSDYISFIFDIDIHTPALPCDESEVLSSTRSTPSVELSIPNPGRRLGASNCSIMGIGLYDPHTAQKIAELEGGNTLMVRFSFINLTLPEGAPIIAGLQIKNRIGEDTCGINTQMEKLAIACPAPGTSMTITAKLKVPRLSPGNYSISPAISSLDGTTAKFEDLIENAIMLNITSSAPVFGQMRIDTDFELELH